MAVDVYQPCPFCTDKKLKFCCADIAEEMEKVGRLSENGQTRVALKILDKLAASHPNTIWNEATRATLLMAERRTVEAREILERLHRVDPENQAVIALLATAAFGADGYQAAREVIWKAFRKATAYGDVLSSLALGIAGEMYGRRSYLAARQHLTLAMRLAPTRDKQAIFLRLLDFDGNSEIPYPLRSVHSLRNVTGDAEREDAARKATRFAERGCFGAAAERFVALAQATPDDPAVEYNFALCAAWEGDDEVAAEAFGRAALAEPDFELAAEYAALEQFLRGNLDQGAARMRLGDYRIAGGSAAKLIGILDDHPRCVRLHVSQEALGPGAPDAIFELIDRLMPEQVESPALDDVPRGLGQLSIYGTPANADEPRAELSAFDGRSFDAAREFVAELGSELEPLEERSDDDLVTTLPRALAALFQRLAFSDQTPAKVKRELESRHWQSMIDAWLDIPQEALIGKSPNQAKDDEGLRVPLAGAIYVLDGVARQNNQTVDVDVLRQRLGLPPVPPIEVGPDLPLNSLSAIQMLRLPVTTLDDRQLHVVLNRALLVHHDRFLRAVLEESVARSLPEIDRTRVFLTLSELARNRGDMAGALHWVAQGREEAKKQANAFETIFRWDAHELSLRLEDPHDPEVEPFVRRLASYYGPKIPQFNEHLGRLLQSAGLNPPTVLEPVGSALGTSPGGVWTPDQPAGGTEEKLWLPGT